MLQFPPDPSLSIPSPPPPLSPSSLPHVPFCGGNTECLSWEAPGPQEGSSGLGRIPALRPSSLGLNPLGNSNPSAHLGWALSCLLHCWTAGLCDICEVKDPLWACLPTCKWEDWTHGLLGPSVKQPLNPSVPRFPQQQDVCRHPSWAYLPGCSGGSNGSLSCSEKHR